MTARGRGARAAAATALAAVAAAAALAVAVLAAAPLVAQPVRSGGPPPASGDAGGGRIVLDQPVKAGGLMLFPVVGEPDSYLYAPMTPRLATDAQGRPQFSFLRYVQNVGGAEGADAPEEGIGGGIVHAVVTLDVPADQLARAQQELTAQRPRAKIVGPAIYRSGTFALISAFQQENGELTKRVVGLGNAPVLEGGKAAVSLQLTKLGAQMLWESFHMPTPDISFAFDMKLPGYWSPAKATIVADLDQVYEHEAIRAAAATPQFEFALNAAMDELIERKAIDVQIVGGAGDAQFQKLVDQTHDLLTNLLFDRAKGIPDPLAEAAKASGGAGGGAESLQKQAEAIRKENLTAREKIRRSEVDRAEAERLEAEAREADARVAELEAELAAAVEKLEAVRAEQGAPTGTPTQTTNREGTLAPDRAQSQAGTGAQRQQPTAPANTAQAQNAPTQGQTAQNTPAQGQTAQNRPTQAQNTQARPQNAPTRANAQARPQSPTAPNRPAQSSPAQRPTQSGAQAPSQTGANSQAGPPSADPKIAAAQREVQDVEKRLLAAKEAAKKAETAAENARKAARDSEVAAAGVEERTALVGLATYQLKKVRRTGEFRYNLDKYSNGELPVRFDENIGDLQRHLDDPQFFRKANLDDPLYKQREIAVYVDGMSAADFAKFVNFVTVQLRKTHQSGEITMDEVRIDRTNLNGEGNRFRLLYGWKGDDDRDRWLEYEWRAVWSFFGGHDVEEPWQRSAASGIRALPPYEIRTVSLEADPENVKDVRSTTVRLFYDLGGKERMEQVTLNTSAGELSTRVPFLRPGGAYDYTYEISWRPRGNRSVSAPRARTDEAILYVDELPEGP